MIKNQFAPAILLTLFITVFTGVIFPSIVWGIGQLCFYYQANGSFIEVGGKTPASELIGQNFSSGQYFHVRPSAAGAGYDANSSSGTNHGPTSKKLFIGIEDDPATSEVDESYSGVKSLAAAYRKLNGLSEDALIPVDAVTRSASGLDPHISPANAKIQAVRVSKARSLKSGTVLELVSSLTERPFLGIFGESRVNVVKLNLALDKLAMTTH